MMGAYENREMPSLWICFGVLSDESISAILF
jgi:hypothetical protein